MDNHLITIKEIWSRVPAELNAVTKAMVQCQAGELQLKVIGKKGNKHFPVTPKMLQDNPPDHFHHAAREGRLFMLREDQVECCAPELDRTTGMPLMMERLDVVMARRSKTGPAALDKPAPPKQAALDMGK